METPVLGLLLSPDSYAHARDSGRAERLRRAAGPDAPCVVVRTEVELEAAARALVGQGCRAVGVDGNDRFVGAAAGALVAAALRDTAAPPILHLYGGRVNAVARALRLPRAAPERLLSAARSTLAATDRPETAHRACVRVNGVSCFFGAAVAFLGFRAELEVEGTAVPGALYRYVMWGTIAAPLGFERTPLLYRAGEIPGAFHVVGDAGSPPEILMSAPRVLSGKPVPRASYVSFLARKLIVRSDWPVRYLLDGYMFPPEDRFVLESGPPIVFLRPTV